MEKKTPNVNVVSNETFTMMKERGMNQSTNADDNVDDEPFNLFSHTKKNIHSN
jgi:outer membrane lipoprotein-sorting protein